MLRWKRIRFKRENPHMLKDAMKEDGEKLFINNKERALTKTSCPKLFNFSWHFPSIPLLSPSPSENSAGPRRSMISSPRLLHSPLFTRPAAFAPQIWFPTLKKKNKKEKKKSFICAVSSPRPWRWAPRKIAPRWFSRRGWTTVHSHNL